MSETNSRNSQWDDLVLGALAGKVSETIEIARSKKALVEVTAGTLYFPVLFEEIEVGGIFIGSGRFVVDAIVETRQGAIGKSHDYSWDGSLLILSSGGEWTPPSVKLVQDKDLKSYHLKTTDEAKERATQILDRFTESKFGWFSESYIRRGKGWRVTILDKERGVTHLIAKQTRLIMKHSDTKIVLDGNRLLQKQGERKIVVASRWGPIVRVS